MTSPEFRPEFRPEFPGQLYAVISEPERSAMLRGLYEAEVSTSPNALLAATNSILEKHEYGFIQKAQLERHLAVLSKQSIIKLEDDTITLTLAGIEVAQLLKQAAASIPR